MHTKGTLRLAVYPGLSGKPDKLNRQNDGSFIVMAGDSGDEDTKPVFLAHMQGKAKRGEAWRTPDPEGEANARRLIACWNAMQHLTLEQIMALPQAPKASKP